MSLPHQEKRGYIDVILAQLDIKDHLLYEIIPPLVEPNVSKALQDHFSTVDNYRKCVPHRPQHCSGPRLAGQLVYPPKETVHFH